MRSSRCDRSPARAGAQGDAKQRSRAPGPRPAPGNKLTYKDQRDLDRLPGEIERIEREIAAAEDALHDADLFTRDPQRFAALTDALTALRATKELAEERWLEVAEMAEATAR